MFSRSTAPAVCVSGKDSMGRHVRCCSMSVSAWAGVNMPRAPSGSGLLLLRRRRVLGLPRTKLDVEALGHVGDFLERGVLLSGLRLFQLGQLILVSYADHGSVVFRLEAAEV